MSEHLSGERPVILPIQRSEAFPPPDDAFSLTPPPAHVLIVHVYRGAQAASVAARDDVDTRWVGDALLAFLVRPMAAAGERLSSLP